VKAPARSCRSSEMQLAVLPPRGATVPHLFAGVESNPSLYFSFLANIQRFRGSVYLADGAVLPHELTEDGRHWLAIDEKSWHVVALDAKQEVCGCLRFLEETAASRFDELWVRNAALTRRDSGASFRHAVEAEMMRARLERVRFGEVGGWAISKDRRRGMDALRVLLATYGLLELLGGCIGVATATTRHGSAEILRRVGLDHLAADGAALPPYYDPQYDCEMEVLRFDSRRANPKFTGWIHELSMYLRTVPVVASGDPLPGARPALHPPLLWQPDPVLPEPVFA
jgi:hypothetical protein